MNFVEVAKPVRILLRSLDQQTFIRLFWGPLRCRGFADHRSSNFINCRRGKRLRGKERRTGGTEEETGARSTPHEGVGRCLYEPHPFGGLVLLTGWRKILTGAVLLFRIQNASCITRENNGLDAGRLDPVCYENGTNL
jgi:hypothetical protein